MARCGRTSGGPSASEASQEPVWNAQKWWGVEKRKDSVASVCFFLEW